MRFVILLILVALIYGCDESSSPSRSSNQNSITISGHIAGPNTGSISRVGLFLSAGSESDNILPSKTGTITDSSWSVTLPSSADFLEFYQVLGWDDENENGKFDKVSGEQYGYGYCGTDSFAIPIMWYQATSDSAYARGWYIQWFGSPSEPLEDHLDDWFIMTQ